jgi:hypothetical protein
MQTRNNPFLRKGCFINFKIVTSSWYRDFNTLLVSIYNQDRYSLIKNKNFRHLVAMCTLKNTPWLSRQLIVEMTPQPSCSVGFYRIVHAPSNLIHNLVNNLHTERFLAFFSKIMSFFHNHNNHGIPAAPSKPNDFSSLLRSYSQVPSIFYIVCNCDMHWAAWIINRTTPLNYLIFYDTTTLFVHLPIMLIEVIFC